MCICKVAIKRFSLASMTRTLFLWLWYGDISCDNNSSNGFVSQPNNNIMYCIASRSGRGDGDCVFAEFPILIDSCICLFQCKSNSIGSVPDSSRQKTV